MSFWGINIKQGEMHSCDNIIGQNLTLSTACLKDTSDDNKYYITLVNKNQTFNLGMLQNDKVETINLSNTFIIVPNMKFSLKGGKQGEVTITGYLDTENDEE